MSLTIAFIGFGEAGTVFARAFLAQGAKRVQAFDILFTDEASMAAARMRGVLPARRLEDAIEGADIVVSAVTAGAALSVARDAAPFLKPSQLFVDVNSVSPATKQAGAAALAARGARYVEAAVMSPVPPYGLKAPMLLGGPHAQAFKDAMAPFATDLTVFSGEIGRASAVKMCRSVMIKGLEALALECFQTARHYGVDAPVLASLGNLVPHPDWPDYARYLMSRALVHGRRRAEEMREAAKTVADAGVTARLSSQVAQAQDEAADIGAALSAQDKNAPSYEALIQAIVNARAQR